MVRDADPGLSRTLRSPRLTGLLGVALAVAFTTCFVTGLISHLIQRPPDWFWWPSRPVGLYRVTQGLHVATGLASVPLLGAKLWSVYPRLFAWPPARDLAHAIERAAVAALVAAALFQLISGILNIARWYAPMPFFFTAGHYWSAWLAIGALITHVGVKLPIIRQALTRATPTWHSPAHSPGAGCSAPSARRPASSPLPPSDRPSPRSHPSPSSHRDDPAPAHSACRSTGRRPVRECVTRRSTPATG